MNPRLYKTDSNAVLRFYEQPSKNNFASEAQGKPVYDTVLMAEIITPGQASSTLEVELERVFSWKPEDAPDRVKRTRDYAKYHAQIEAYRNETGEFVDDGMPIRNWAQIDRGTAETLAAQGIHTVEALAGISDGNLSNLGTGARMLRDKAQAYITSREFGIPTAQMTSDNEKFKQENAMLREQLEASNFEVQRLSQEIAKLTGANPNNAPAKTVDQTPVLV